MSGQYTLGARREAEDMNRDDIVGLKGHTTRRTREVVQVAARILRTT